MHVSLQLTPSQATRVLAYWRVLQEDPYAQHPQGKLRSELDGYDLMEQGPLARRGQDTWRFGTPELGFGFLSINPETFTYDGPRKGIGGPAFPLSELVEPGADLLESLAVIPVRSYKTRQPTWAWWETAEEWPDADPSRSASRELARAQLQAIQFIQNLLESRRRLALPERADESGFDTEELDNLLGETSWDAYNEMVADAVTDFEIDVRRVCEILSIKAGTFSEWNLEIDIQDLMQTALKESMHASRANEIWLRAIVQSDLPPLLADHFGLLGIIKTLIALAIQRAQSCSDVVAHVWFTNAAHRFDVTYVSRGLPEEDVAFFNSTSDLYQAVDSSRHINWEIFDLVHARSRVAYSGGDLGADVTPGGGARIWITWPRLGHRKATGI